MDPSMSENVVRLSFPAKPDYLLLARLALSGIGRTTPLSEELLADLKLAITEACGNCVRHAYPDGEGDVSVLYAFDDQALEMVVEDSGVGIEGEPPRPTDDSGMGMAIIRTVVDELEIGPGVDGRGTVVRMTKRLESPEG
jgi:anti-sigma regulatory factor (Ser/Thr protein kinase)